MLILLLIFVSALRGGFRRLWMWSLLVPWAWYEVYNNRRCRNCGGYYDRRYDRRFDGPRGGFGPRRGCGDCHGPEGGFGPRGCDGSGRY